MKSGDFLDEKRQNHLDWPFSVLRNHCESFEILIAFFKKYIRKL
jgi:hypothetical protein